MPTPLYAIGDIHGQVAMLDQVLEWIEADGGPDASVVLLGDYTDRGPDSRAVLDRLVDGVAAGRNWTCLKGNHDRMFQWFMEDVPRHDPHLLVGYHWLHPRLGGVETLASYGVTVSEDIRLKDLHCLAKDAVPQTHVDFLKRLTLTFETNDLFFCHAGIRPNVALAEQDEEDLVWIRQPFHKHTAPHPKLIVHGHTPAEQAMHYGNRVNLDSGAGYGRPLTAAVFEAGKCWVLGPEGRQPILQAPA